MGSSWARVFGSSSPPAVAAAEYYLGVVEIEGVGPLSAAGLSHSDVPGVKLGYKIGAEERAGPEDV